MNWRCDKCNKFFPLQVSNNQLKLKIICPFCGDTSTWSVSVYPNPQKENIDKQVDYIMKDIEQRIKEL